MQYSYVQLFLLFVQIFSDLPTSKSDWRYSVPKLVLVLFLNRHLKWPALLPKWVVGYFEPTWWFRGRNYEKRLPDFKVAYYAIMEYRNIGSTLAVYLMLEFSCGVMTALWLFHGERPSAEFAGWAVPALVAYASQLVLSVVLIRAGTGLFISNFAKSLLALLMSSGLMLAASYLLYHQIKRVEFQGVDYVGAFVVYALGVPGQLIVMILGPIVLAYRNARGATIRHQPKR